MLTFFGTDKMRFESSWLLALIFSGSWATASPVKSQKPKIRMPYHEIDLDAFELGLTNTTLSERLQIQVCGATIELAFDRFLAMGAFGLSLATGIANLVFANSDDRSRTAKEFHDPDYQYAAMAEGNCHTTAQRNTIQGAIDHYIDKEIPKSACGVQCMNLTHGGNWEGEVVFGAGTYD